ITWEHTRVLALRQRPPRRSRHLRVPWLPSASSYRRPESLPNPDQNVTYVLLSMRRTAPFVCFVCSPCLHASFLLSRSGTERSASRLLSRLFQPSGKRTLSLLSCRWVIDHCTGMPGADGR